jgi:CrcB protein
LYFLTYCVYSRFGQERWLPQVSLERFLASGNGFADKLKVKAILLVFIGGALGSVCRFWWSGLVARRFGEIFPLGTLVVNLVASAAIGLISRSLLHFGATDLTTAAQQFLVVGICGGLSTFSSLSLQTWNLMVERR